MCRARVDVSGKGPPDLRGDYGLSIRRGRLDTHNSRTRPKKDDSGRRCGSFTPLRQALLSSARFQPLVASSYSPAVSGRQCVIVRSSLDAEKEMDVRCAHCPFISVNVGRGIEYMMM